MIAMQGGLSVVCQGRGWILGFHRALSMLPVLQLLVFDHEFMVECDFSKAGFGTVLHQGNGLVAFFNKPIVSRHANVTSWLNA
jgi:hypothetical protein